MTTPAFSEADTSVQYQAGFIVLSYFISWVGCASTLELLHRRTSCRGAFNWYLLIASSILMGGVGIWSMHFVGNRAIILDDGAANRQLSYNQGFTTLSFFLPIVVLVVAFYVLALSEKATKVYILFAGLLTGTAVCAMHYVGQVGIANYDCSYHIGNIVGAAIIAVVASLVSLSVFFRLRNTWTDSWWKRSLCAAILACAVSGMHWTAAIGTVYHFRADRMTPGSRTRVQTVIFCAVLSLASCVLLLAIAFITRRRSRVHRRRAQELVLACVYFDENDRVMVSHDGFLPYQKITNQFIRKTFGEDELNRSHPAFMWVYEASRNWSTLRELVPNMQGQLESDPIARKFQPGHEDSIDLSRSSSTDFNLIFKQLFCVAADRLAGQIHESMEDLGVLFEEPLETGTTKSNKAIQNHLAGLANVDIENGKNPKLFGKGRYLFLNRRLTKNQAADFAALGYRFGSAMHVAESLARNMQVSHESMLSRLERMKICISREHLHPAGIHLACFLLRPSIHAGFDILVPTVSQNQLPMISLPITELSTSHMEVLQSINEWTVRDILKELITEENKPTNQQKDFRWHLYSAFVRLVDMVKDSELMMDARFSARPVQTPSRSPEGLNAASTCIIFSVRYLGSIHSSYSQEALTYVPFDFFSAQQLVETSEARHQTFKRRVHIEFGVTNLHRKDEDEEEMKAIVSDSEGFSQIKSHEEKPQRRSSLGRSFLSHIGIKPPKRPRQDSKSAILFPGYLSGRSTAEPDSTNTSPTMRKELNVSTEEIDALKMTESPSPSSRKEPTIKDKESDEIELRTLTDTRGTFVSELFSLFRLSHSSERGKLRLVV